MLRPAILRRACATLCVALTLVFVGAAAASTINAVQHMNGDPGVHDHVLFSNISLDDDDNHSDLHSGDSGSHHHHHGDISTGMAAMPANGVSMPMATGDRYHLARDHVRVSIRLSLPERPPRA